MTTSEPFVSIRRFGDATVTVISMMYCEIDMGYGVDMDTLLAVAPDANDRGELPGGMNAVHIRLGDSSILIDPGFDDPSSTSTGRLLEAFPEWHPTPGLEAGLAEIDVRPEEITHVPITHAHFDHTLGLVTGHGTGDLRPRFPNARHYLGSAEPVNFRSHDEIEIDPEWHIFRQMTMSCHGDLQVIREAGLLEFIDGETEILPGLTMIPSPGESAGHYVVRLESGGEVFWFLGDLVHHGCEVDRPEWVMAGGRDLAAMARSRELIYPLLAAENATAVFAHGLFPGWGGVERSGDGYHWRYD